MRHILSNKRKIINDPVHGFITLPYDLTFDLIEHPWMQRLRRIKQLGLTNLVYPSAVHSRFQHVTGAMFLMSQAIEVLRSKDITITEQEAEDVTHAILLHDIGHGPFSHSLENCLVKDMDHEDLTLLFMHQLNDVFEGALSGTIDIFLDRYPKKFLHQLVSGQLDMDRLDYLKRDSFYTGVVEGAISTERIIKMLHVDSDRLVVESKGIYSIENFIISRRLMYWQVYLHKTSLVAENILSQLLRRARSLAERQVEMFATPALKTFLYNHISKKDFEQNPSLLKAFAELDDTDLMTSFKMWIRHPDKVLAMLCNNLINRRLFKVEIENAPFDEHYVQELKHRTARQFQLTEEEASYLVSTGIATNNTYNPAIKKINILFKNGQVRDIAQASDQLDETVLSKTVNKYYLCYPKEVAV